MLPEYLQKTHLAKRQSPPPALHSQFVPLRKNSLSSSYPERTASVLAIQTVGFDQAGMEYSRVPERSPAEVIQPEAPSNSKMSLCDRPW